MAGIGGVLAFEFADADSRLAGGGVAHAAVIINAKITRKIFFMD
jgi:hypothetical protein